MSAQVKMTVNLGVNMQNNIEPSLIVQILHSFSDVIVGLVGGIVGYLLSYKSKKESNPEHRFSFSMLLINIIIGGFAAYMFGTAIDESWKYKDFVLGSIGVASYPIMTFIESKALSVLLNKISKMIGIDEKDLKE